MFRKEALESRKIKWRGKAILLNGIPSWLVVMLCALFFVSFIIFLISGSYTRRTTVSGEVTTYPRSINIYSDVQGIVVKQFVTEGQILKKGDPVYLIDVSKTTKTGVVNDLQTKDIKEQIARIENIISQLELSKNSTLDMLEKQKSQYTNALRQSIEILSRAKEGVHIMKNNMDNYRRYQANGLINKDQLTNQVSLYYQQQNNLLSLSSQNEQNALQITNLESQIKTQAANFDNQIYQMELKLYDLQKEMISTDANGEIVIRALSDGKIDSLSVTVGQMVNAGDSLLQLLPQKISHYYLVLWVPNDAVSYISPGDKVNVRYEAFPSEKFGQFSATVTLVSKTPASPQEMLTYQGAPRSTQTPSVPYYKVMIKPKKKVISYNGRSMSLQNGMKAQSTLFLEKRKIYQWMLSPFYDMKHSAMGPVNEK